MAFVYPFPENINQYTVDWLDKLLKYIWDNISYYKFNVQDYNWEIYNLPLTNKEWLAKVKKDINKYEYILLSYNLYPRSIYPIEKEIRWIVFRNKGNGDFECIARPLHKFYNVGEEIYINSYISWIEWIPDDDNDISFYFNWGDLPTVEMKEDWAMIQVFLDENSNLPNKISLWDNKQLVFNTKNTLAKNIFVDDFVNNFEDKDMIVSSLFSLLNHLKKKYNEKATLIFEYVNPELEAHVVQYDKKQMYLIDIRLNESWKYLSYEEKVEIFNQYFNNTNNISLVKKQDIKDANELLKKREEQYIEGYVLKKFESDGDFFHYTKFKTKWYLDRWFYDWLDIINFSLKDLLVLYTLWEEDTFFQKIDNPKNTEQLRRINVDPKNYKNFINEATKIFQDKLVDDILLLRDNIYDYVNNLQDNVVIDWKFVYQLQEKDINTKLFKKIVLYLLNKNNLKSITKEQFIDIILDNNQFVDIILDLMYLSIFYLDSNKWKSRKKYISKLINSAIECDSFTEWSNEIFEKNHKGDFVVITDKQELVTYAVHLFEALYNALKKISKQINNKNFLFIFYNLVYEDIYNELEQKWLDRNTFNLILDNIANVIWLSPKFEISIILSDIYKYKNKVDPASDLINKIINKKLNSIEKDIYYDITKEPNTINLLRLYKFDKMSYQRLKNIDNNYIVDMILSSIFY